MFGNVTALEGLHVTGKDTDKSMLHTCSRHAAWDPHEKGSRTGKSRAVSVLLACTPILPFHLEPPSN